MSEGTEFPVPRVSVVMPVYNGERFLRVAVDSILGQSLRDLELVVIDDGSTDSTPEILASYRDPRLRVLRNETNLRLIRTLNRGIEHARGEYIARMDADDVSLPDRLESQVAFLESTGADLVAASFCNMDEEGNLFGVHHSIPASPALLELQLCFMNPISHPAVLGKAECFRAFGYRLAEDALHVEDLDLWIRLLQAGRSLRISDRVGVHYRRTGGNITVRHYGEGLDRAMELMRRWQKECYSFELPRSAAQLLIGDARLVAHRGQVREAVDCLRHLGAAAVARHPEEAKAYAHWVDYRTSFVVLKSRLGALSRFRLAVEFLPSLVRYGLSFLHQEILGR